MKRKPAKKSALATAPVSGYARALAAAELRAKAAKQRLRLAKSGVKRARKQFKEEKKAVKQLRKRLASEEREVQRAKRRARAARPAPAGVASAPPAGAAKEVKKKRAQPAPPPAVRRSSVRATTSLPKSKSKSRNTKRPAAPLIEDANASGALESGEPIIDSPKQSDGPAEPEAASDPAKGGGTQET